jgi:hypothetical protein
MQVIFNSLKKINFCRLCLKCDMPLSHQSIVAVNLPGPGIVAGEGGGFVIVFLLKWLTMSKTLSLSTGTNIRTFLQFHQIVNLFLRRQILNFYVCFH